MPTKNKLLKKRLIKITIIILVILSALGGGAFLLSNYDDDTQATKDKESGVNSSITSDFNTVKTLLGTQLEVTQAYQTYSNSNNHNNDFVLNREAITDLLSKMREKYHFMNMEITVSPISDVPTSNPVLKTGTLTKSDVITSFDALTDTSVYDYIEALQRTVPGIVIIREVKITRTGDISRAVLVDLSHHKLTALIKAQVSFAWVGIRPKALPPAAITPPGAPNVPGAPNAR